MSRPWSAPGPMEHPDGFNHGCCRCNVSSTCRSSIEKALLSRKGESCLKCLQRCGKSRDAQSGCSACHRACALCAGAPWRASALLVVRIFWIFFALIRHPPPTPPCLEVRCTYNLLSNCSYNPTISLITTGTLDIIGL